MTDLERFMNQTGLSGASIARTLGLSTGTISLVKNGRAVSDDNAKTISDYIANYRQKKNISTSAADLVKTDDLAMVQFTCDETIINQEMGVIYGKAGTGKTCAIKDFVSTRPEAILIETVPMMSVKSLLIKILDQQGIKNAQGKAEDLLDQVVISFKKSDRVLLVDEAENLTTKSLEAIRRIHDFSATPVLLIGTYSLLQNLKGRNGELLQLYSRISNKWEMKGLNDKDRTSLFGNLGAQIKRYTSDIRRSVSIYRKAMRYSQIKKEPLDSSHIQIATQSVILD